MLWLPPNWWHQVRSLEVAVSVNFWWTPHIDQILFMDELVGQMPAIYEAGFLEEYLLTATETRDFPGLIDMAERCRELGKDWAAVLVGATALEQCLRRIGLRHNAVEAASARSLRVADLNARLTQAGIATRLDETEAAGWSRLTGQAKALDEARLGPEEVAALLARAQAFIREACA